jgi:Ca-activated chloride channel family protein
MNTAVLRTLFAQPQALWLLLALPGLSLLAFFARRRRRRILMRFGRLPALAALTERRAAWRRLRGLCWLIGITALIVGIAGVQWGREPEPTTAPGRDLVVVLDVSRSMLANDVAPAASRQELAKQGLLQLAATLQRRGGNRVALVAFAAHAEVICPLTHDYDHFREKLLELNAAQLPNELRPGKKKVGNETIEPASGTRIGAGLRAAVQDAHDTTAARRGFQDILLISDGDDPLQGREHAKGTPGREWELAATLARDAGIPIYTVGVGTVAGGRIPYRDYYLTDAAGKVVESKFSEKPLRYVAEQTRGKFLGAFGETPPLGELFRASIEPGPKQEVTDDALPLYRQRYPWFFGTALFFLAVEMILGRTLRPRKVKPVEKARAVPRPAPALAKVG